MFFWYTLTLLLLIFSLSLVTDFKKFFFISELIWLSLFTSLLCAALVTNNISIYANCFFILIFTASESLILASILLIANYGETSVKPW